MIENRWNHCNFSVAEEKFPAIEACFDTLFGWEKYVARPKIIGYRLQQDHRAAAVYIQPTDAAGRAQSAIARLRAQDTELDQAIRELETISPDYNDHFGYFVDGVEAWEAQLAHIQQVSHDHPEWQVNVRAFRPGDPGAPSTLCQAFIRVGLLGPLRNTIEMQAAVQ